jgi:hypothetical protein
MLCMSFMVVGVRGHNPAYEVVAVYGSTPAIDGSISVSEWSDAASVSFNNTEVFVKQDGINLYIGFNNSDDQFHDEDIIVVAIDVDHDGSLTPQADDVGLGVYRNGTIGEANVTGGTWGFKEVSGWTAAVNSALNMWQVEFNITYAKVNVVAGVEKTMGVVFVRYRGLNASSPEMLSWPPGMEPSDPMGNPSTWGAITSAGYNWTRARLPGVAAGQFVHYEVYAVWNGGNDTELESWVGNQPGSGINVTVLSVVNTTVTYETVQYNSTGIVYNYTRDVDVETGFYSDDYFLIAANLTAGDVVYTKDNNTRINETALASYLGQQLETNHLSSIANHSSISFIGLPYYFSATISEDHYWHRQSGMLLEMKYEFHTSRVSGSDVLVGHFVLGAVAALSSPPVIPEFPSFLILPLFIVATLPPVIVYRRKCIGAHTLIRYIHDNLTRA